MMMFIDKIIEWYEKWVDIFTIDPVKHCETYKDQGCAHVGGFLCNMDTCSSYRKINK